MEDEVVFMRETVTVQVQQDPRICVTACACRENDFFHSCDGLHKKTLGGRERAGVTAASAR